MPLRRTIIGVVVLAALALPGIARATGGPAYSAASTVTGPTLDGTIGATEWQDAPVYSLSFGSIPATVRFLHTSTALYVGVVVRDFPQGAAPSLTVYVDNTHNGVKDTGDDAWINFVGQSGEDFFYSSTASSHVNDLTSGGINDTLASGATGAAGITFEIEHPLCSADTAHDMCIQPNDTIGLDFQYEPGTAPGVFSNAPGPDTFDPSLSWADLTLTSGDIAAPSVTVTAPTAGSTLSGTNVAIAADASDNVGVTSVDFQYYDGTTFHEIGTDTTFPYSATFDSTSVADTPVGSATIYAAATDAAGHLTKVGNAVGVSNGPAGSLSGSIVTGPGTLADPTSVDLTAQGSQDWAVWGFASGGTSTSLAPDVSKANGFGISDLTNIDPAPSVPLRGIGQFSAEPFRFNWSDGGGTQSATGATAGIQHDGEAPVSLQTIGKGFAFDVPADTSTHTLRVYVSTNRAAGQLTATLSDGSATAYTATLPAAAETAFAVYTIHYAAASARQTLHVQWVETENDCPEFFCDNAALYAVALSTDTDAATGATASLSTGRVVGISGSNDPIADLPLRAFEPAPTGTTPAPINGLPINGLPINGLPINGLPINGLPINGLPINGLPINGLPINGLPINGLPINGLPINGLPLTTPGGWAAVLQGTTLAGLPLQTVTLQQVFALSPRPAAVEHLTLGQLDLSNSTLGQMTIGALALGATPINGLGLPADALTSLLAWCSCSSSTLASQSLFALGLAGAPINGLPINGLPINGLPINGLPINGLPINGLDISASPINGLPINGLATGATPINGLSLASIVAADAPDGSPSPFGTIKIADLANQANVITDCTGSLNCATGTLADAANASAIKSTATLADVGATALGALTLGDLHYYDDLTIADLELSLVGTNATLGDLIGLLIRRADVPWETLSPRLLSVFDPERRQLSLSAHFTFAGTGVVAGQAQVTLPDGFDVVPGSATLSTGEFSSSSLTDPVVDGDTATWDLPFVSTGTAYTLGFTAFSGTDVGPAQATTTVSSGDASATASAAFNVTDSFEPNDDAANPELPTITPDDAVEQSAISTRGDVDFYKVALPPAGTRLLVHLTNLPADYDLALYASQTTAVRTGATAAGAPLTDGTVPDQPINTQGGTNAQLTPTALQDVPDPGIPVVQVSPNRGKDDEDVGMVSPGGSGYALIGVFGYNGASSPEPYSLRVTTQAPTALTCPPRSFTNHGGEGTSGTLPSLPSDLNTLVLVNEQRIGDTYGAAAESDVVAALTRFAGDRSLGVSGAVIPVEGLAQAQYDTWDANPCDVSAANAVANAIADEIAQVQATHQTLKYVVIAGGDDEIPFFRVPDLSRIANENGFASSFDRNEYYGALASSDLLSDNPYLDTRPVPASGRQLFIPDLVGGRLVEKPDQIVSAITKYESSNGTLARSTAFVSGYDFVSDGSSLVQSRLDSFLGTPTRTLIDNTWSKTDLFAHAFPTGGPADINDWNGHFDNHQALAANGDRANLITTTDLTGVHALSGGIFFTMGCHAGFQTTDAIVGGTSPDALDWSEYFAGTGTSFVGNTGFGLGNTDSVAFSEELMADFAGNLGGSLSIGEALTRAKQDYYLGRTAFSSYDEKTLSEAELYGLPMYGVGTAPAAVGATTPGTAASPDPVRGTSSSTSPSQGSLTPLAPTIASVASFDVTPAFSTVQNGAHGQYLTNAGQVQAPNYRPLQPFVTLSATRSGQVAHGVLIDALTSSDVSPFDPDNVRPTLDLTANEPEPQFADEAWPTKVPTLVTLNDANGLRQSLNLATGQFFTDSAAHTGVERKWTHISGRVTYSSSTDVVPPTIDSIDAFISGGAVAFTGRFSDLTETGAAGTVALAQVVYDVDNGGTWVALPLQKNASTGIWSGGAAFSGTQVQYFVEACDTAGNCGFSSNKGRYFDAQPLPGQGSSTITLTPDRAPNSGNWYTAPLNVTAAAGTADVSVSVDGGALTPTTSPIPLSESGVHILDARASDGSETTGVFLVDLTDPTTPVFTGVQGGINPVNDLPLAGACTSTDAVSGLKSCVVSGYSTALGTHTLTAIATDNAGRTSRATLTYTVGFQVGGILSPVTAPSGDQGNVAATDLQVFRIKSTIPIKFQLYLDAAKTLLLKTPPAGSVARLTVTKVATSTSSSDTPVLISGTADAGNVFRFAGSPDFQYVYNLPTSGQTSGKYSVMLTLFAAPDGTTQLAQSAKQYFILKS
jgi:hypothetical protein